MDVVEEINYLYTKYVKLNPFTHFKPKTYLRILNDKYNLSLIKLLILVLSFNVYVSLYVYFRMNFSTLNFYNFSIHFTIRLKF